MTDKISQSFSRTRNIPTGHLNYPDVPGLYALSLAGNSSLSEFAMGNQIVYIGIAKYSLRDRDFKQHFSSGKTGSSTVRRALGAILKKDLNLTAIPRGGANDSKRFIYYKFYEEQKLTDWMTSNLKIGYWIPDEPISYNALREFERTITIELKPTLDLDNRTRKFNPLAEKLNSLKGICIDEARTNS